MELTDWSAADWRSRGLRWGGVVVVAAVILYWSVITVPPEVTVGASGENIPAGGTGENASVGSEGGNTTESTASSDATELSESDDGTDLFAWLAEMGGGSQSQWQHLVAYAVLAGSLAYATRPWQRRRGFLALSVVGVCSLYGLGMELLQMTVADRSARLGDVLVNTIGASLVLPMYLIPTLRERVGDVVTGRE